ncbi:hypothetical protein ACSAZL_04025 [Methanosarcina sp. T3]|uniref:hypothetical protein n=1 Tax=Methanosarcina sp. T3 TaxID=3439062 RepID=UPI003F8568DB
MKPPEVASRLLMYRKEYIESSEASELQQSSEREIATVSAGLSDAFFCKFIPHQEGRKKSLSFNDVRFQMN